MTNQKKIIEFEIVRTRAGSVSFKQEQGKVNVYLDGELSSIGDYLMNEDDREDMYRYKRMLETVKKSKNLKEIFPMLIEAIIQEPEYLKSQLLQYLIKGFKNSIELQDNFASISQEIVKLIKRSLKSGETIEESTDFNVNGPTNQELSHYFLLLDSIKRTKALKLYQPVVQSQFLEILQTLMNLPDIYEMILLRDDGMPIYPIGLTSRRDLFELGLKMSLIHKIVVQEHHLALKHFSLETEKSDMVLFTVSDNFLLLITGKPQFSLKWSNMLNLIMEITECLIDGEKMFVMNQDNNQINNFQDWMQSETAQVIIDDFKLQDKITDILNLEQVSNNNDLNIGISYQPPINAIRKLIYNIKYAIRDMDYAYFTLGGYIIAQTPGFNTASSWVPNDIINNSAYYYAFMQCKGMQKMNILGFYIFDKVHVETFMITNKAILAIHFPRNLFSDIIKLFLPQTRKKFILFMQELHEIYARSTRKEFKFFKKGDNYE